MGKKKKIKKKNMTNTEEEVLCALGFLCTPFWYILF